MSKWTASVIVTWSSYDEDLYRVKRLKELNVDPLDKIVEKMEEKMKVRTKNATTSPYEKRFWDKFPTLLLDDIEDEHNHIIQTLRHIAVKLLEELHKTPPYQA